MNRFINFSLLTCPLKPGDQAWAYNQQNKKMELEVIRHLWVTHDNDLVDLTLTTQTAASKGKSAHQSSETVHTNKKHPFLTAEKGFVPVAQLKLRMHIVEASGRVGDVTGWESVPGVQTMYNLEVTQDHTYTVGVGQWVVHNSGSCTTTLYRAVSDGELHDVDKYRDYGLNPHGGKYFAFAESDVRRFANSSFNRGLNMNLTKVNVPNEMLEHGYQFFDSGGAGNAIHFSDEVLPDLYHVMGNITKFR